MQSVDLAKVIFELFQYSRAPAARTVAFSRFQHNRDLCPAFQKRMEDVIDGSLKYGDLVYDIQGPSDKGGDVLARLGSGDDLRLVCLQVKSENDLHERGFLDTLRRQWLQAVEHYTGISDYYIVICADAVKSKDRIRLAEAEFAQRPGVHVIEPEYAMTFLSLTVPAIDAEIRRVLGEGDAVLRDAESTVANLEPLELATLLYMTQSWLFSGERRFDSAALASADTLEDVAAQIPDRDRDGFSPAPYTHWEESGHQPSEEDEPVKEARELVDRLPGALQVLESTFLTESQAGLELETSSITSLVALMAEAAVRYRFRGPELIIYMMSVVGDCPST